MKCLFLLPPVWQPQAPPLGISSLVAQLRKHKIKSEAIDLNVKFFNEILEKSYLKKSTKNLYKIKEEIDIDVQKYENIDIKIEDYPIEITTLLTKKRIIDDYFRCKSHYLDKVPELINRAVSNIKSNKFFYNPESYRRSNKLINDALEIASLPYAPTEILFYSHENQLLKYNYELIKYFVFSESTNIFVDFYKKWLPKILKKKAKYIGISINTNTQLIAGLTLSNLLKKHTNAHISIGGTYFSRILESLEKEHDFFDLFADSIMVNEGDKPILELVKYLDGKIPIEDVPNLVYKKDNKIIRNDLCEPYCLDELPIPDFSDYDFSDYLTPEVVLPVETNRGCYWAKCTFCDFSHGKRYSFKNVNKLINELKEYKKKYKTNNFNIIDEAVHPSYLNELADKLIENKLNINYHFYSRTESGFTKEILQKARASGLRMVLWGIEFGSRRVLEFSNKGVDFDTRFDILKNAHDAGIWNNALTFCGLPTETKDEAKQTIDIIRQNRDIIDSNAVIPFVLSNQSIISKDPSKYGITNFEPDAEPFATGIKFDSLGMTHKEVREVIELHMENNKDLYGYSFSALLNRISMFLYLIKYDIDWLKNYKLQCPANNQTQKKQCNLT